MMFFSKIFRRFFFSLDSVLFNFIATLYDLLMAISRTTVLTQGDISKFVTRIEVMLGIFMLFKLSFSLITYIVNPDDFSDKSKGFGKLIQNSVISLVLLVTTPYIFQMAFNLQQKVLEGNVLARLMLGDDMQPSDMEDNFLLTAGEKISFYVMLPFFKPNYSINLGEGSDLSECINIYEKDDSGTSVFSESCKNALISINEDERNGMDDTDIENYANGISEQSLGLTFRINAAISTIGSDSNEQFVIDYMSPISTVVAVIVCLLLVTFCIDIGIRSVKLAFLQLIYPIPVLSYMDPKSGKDGMFSKWYKMCFSTFLSLFIRLLALYFGLYIISRIGSVGLYDVVNGSQITNGWVMIFIIIGVLMFVKQLPKILENMGIKIEGDGNFNLNPLKKVFDEKNGIAGAKGIKRAGIAAGAAGLAGAAAIGANALTGAQRLRDAKGFKGKAKALFGGAGSMLAGGMSGLTRGARAGLKGEKFGKAYSDSYSTAMKNKQARADRKDDNVSWGEMMSSKAKQNLGIHTEGEKSKSKIEALSRMVKLKDEATNIADKSDSNIKDLLRQKDAISKIDPKNLVGQSYGGSTASNIAEAVEMHSKMIKDKDDAIDAARATYFASQGEGTAVNSIFSEMKDIAEKYKADINAGFANTGSPHITVDSFTINDIKAAGTAAINAQQSFEQSSDARHSQTVDKYGAKKDAK